MLIELYFLIDLLQVQHNLYFSMTEISSALVVSGVFSLAGPSSALTGAFSEK